MLSVLSDTNASCESQQLHIPCDLELGKKTYQKKVDNGVAFAIRRTLVLLFVVWLMGLMKFYYVLKGFEVN